MSSYIQCRAQDSYLYQIKCSGSSLKSGTSPRIPTISGIRPVMALLYPTRDPEWPSEIQLKACDPLFYIQLSPPYPISQGTDEKMSDMANFEWAGVRHFRHIVGYGGLRLIRYIPDYTSPYPTYFIVTSRQICIVSSCFGSEAVLGVI